MSKMKNEDIKVLNLCTEDLIAYIIRADHALGETEERVVSDQECVNEIIDRLRRLDVLKHDLDVVINSLDTGV
uniref:Uncharacterized protein n=2 Tax=viral metagenome TaxID=1070528 RepID=A0A6H1ZGA4_9ZZZZ